MVEDFTPFLNLGVPVELTVVQGSMPELPPDLKVLPKEETAATLPPETTGNPTTTAPNACDICKGSGAVALFPDGSTPAQGTPVTCEACKGTGLKPA